MKPLASVVTEYGLVGSLALVAGTALAAVAAASEKPLVTVAAFLLTAPVYGGFMYWVSHRGFVQNAVTRARDMPETATREAPGATRYRVLRTTALLAIPMMALVWLVVGTQHA